MESDIPGMSLDECIQLQWDHSVEFRTEWREYERANKRSRTTYARHTASVDRRYGATQ